MSELKKIKISDKKDYIKDLISSLREDYIKNLISTFTEGIDNSSELLCPTCRGTGLVISKSIDGTPILHICADCCSGVVRKCEFCGKMLNRYESCNCIRAVYSRLLNDSVDAKECSFEDAKKESPMFYFPFFPDDLDNLNYFETWDDFFDSYNYSEWGKLNIDRPEYIYGTSEEEFELEAMSILSGELDYRGLDVEKTINSKDIKRLQSMLTEWSTQVKVPPCYTPNLSIKVRIPWESVVGD